MFDLDRKIRQIQKSTKSYTQDKVLNLNANNFFLITQTSSVNHVTHSSDNTEPTQAYISLQASESIPCTQFIRQSSSVYSDYHKIPKFNLPTFSGSALDWLSFWDTYESAIQKNPGHGTKISYSG